MSLHRRFTSHGLLCLLLCAGIAGQSPTYYGNATAGTGGKKPTLTAASMPRVGETFELKIANGRPGATAMIFAAVEKADVKLFGVQVLIDLTQVVILPIGTLDKNGEATIKIPVTDAPDSVIGTKLYAQAYIADPAAPTGIATSAGLAGSLLSAKITLPIEVLGKAGLVQTVRLDIGKQARLAHSLWLQVHGLGEGHASVRLNGGTWVDLTNSNKLIAIENPDVNYGGIGGGFHTIRLRVLFPTTDFKDGVNVVSFRFNKTDNVRIGYRVLQLDIQDSATNDLVEPSSFTDDDPSKWLPPSSKAADIASGKELWYGKVQLLNHTGTGGSKILASCSSCHAHDGADLKYYNYSNRSIVERSIFHGLTRTQGEQVASYVRSLPIGAPANARPWNPPFQPGPGTDKRPASEWAAGAGLDAVLANDKAMLPHLFGKATRSEIDTTTNVKSTLNLREIPLAVQFPDWNHWLPEVHPLDIWGKTWFENGEAHHQYLTLRGQLLNGVAASSLVSTFNKFQEQLTYFLRSGIIWGASWTTDWGNSTPTLNARDKSYSIEYSKYNLALWGAVKQWEMTREFQLWDKVPDTNAEARQWPSTRFVTFHIAPHFIGDERAKSHFAGQNQVVGTYMSSIWYQVQTTLNPGLKLGDSIEPVDWTYNYQLIQLLGERTGVYEPLRYFQNLIKGYQQRNRGVVSAAGWTMREVSPWRLYSNFNGDDRLQAALNTYTSDEKLRARVTDSMLLQFLTVAEAIPATKWPVYDVGDGQLIYWYSLERPTYVPILDPTKNVLSHTKLFARDGSYSAVEADAIARLLDKRLANVGVDCKLIARLGQWAKQFWPKHNWTVVCE